MTIRKQILATLVLATVVGLCGFNYWRVLAQEESRKGLDEKLSDSVRISTEIVAELLLLSGEAHKSYDDLSQRNLDMRRALAAVSAGMSHAGLDLMPETSAMRQVQDKALEREVLIQDFQAAQAVALNARRALPTIVDRVAERLAVGEKTLLLELFSELLLTTIRPVDDDEALAKRLEQLRQIESNNPANLAFLATFVLHGQTLIKVSKHRRELLQSIVESPVTATLRTLEVSNRGDLAEARALRHTMSIVFMLSCALLLAMIVKTLRAMDLLNRSLERLVAVRTTELHQEQKTLESLIHQAADAIYVCSTEGVILKANREARKLSGEAGESIIGRKLWSQFDPKLGDAISAAVIRGESKTLEGHCLRLSGETPIVEMRLGPVLEGEKVTSYLAIARNIDERKRLETERDRAKETAALAQKLAALGQMAGGIAHEINNPLAVIGVRANQIQRLARTPGVDPATLVKVGETIEHMVDRIVQIVRGLQRVARSSSNDPMEHTNSDAILEQTLAYCSERFKRRGISLVRPPSEHSADLICRPTEISQILINLLNNAIDAVSTLDEKWVKLEVVEHEGDVAFVCTDSGTGLQPNDLGRLVEPFFTTKDVGKGTGLGLSISKTILERHGGSLELRTPEGRTQFVVHLPSAKSGKLAA